MENKSTRLKVFFATLFAIIAFLVLIRLGLWQLDRLEWRRSFNQHYLEQISLPELDLNLNLNENNLLNSEYRKIRASGKYDFSQQVFLQNQIHQNTPGYHVLTPFVLNGTNKAIIIDRGWISLEDQKKMDQIDLISKDINSIRGVLRLGEKTNSFGINPENKNLRNDLFLLVNLEKIQEQVDFDLLPFYLQVEKNPVEGLPFPKEIEVEITEGPHQGYAIQWFFFASLLAVGFPFFVKNLIKAKHFENQ